MWRASYRAAREERGGESGGKEDSGLGGGGGGGGVEGEGKVQVVRRTDALSDLPCG